MGEENKLVAYRQVRNFVHPMLPYDV